MVACTSSFNADFGIQLRNKKHAMVISNTAKYMIMTPTRPSNWGVVVREASGDLGASVGILLWLQLGKKHKKMS